MSLHDDVMNIPVTANIAEIGLKEHMIAYKEGHRDARHAAAELALQAENKIEDLQAELENTKFNLRRSLELIAVGDALDPVKFAEEVLIELGIWEGAK